ncbi:hypothetical protein KAR91_35510, partial [Candidatus Pacearchaeota archaeon]|nr:hypothetical protein [Candidatus Pacearchaeota archaeon]
KDFCNLLVEAGQATAEEVKNPKNQRKYVAGLQYFLTDHFSSAGVSFELNDGKKINKFTYVDGLLGGYTVSVLGAYLTSPLYGKKKEEWTRLEGGLHDDFTKGKSGRKKEFGAAVTHLRGQLDNADYTKAGISTVEVKPGAPVNPNVVADSNPIVSPVSPDKKDGEVQQSSVEVASVEEKRIRKDALLLSGRMTRGRFYQGRYFAINNIYEQQKKDVQEIKGTPDKDPDVLWFGGKLNNLDGSWSQVAHDDYFEMWDESESEDKQFDSDLIDSLSHLEDTVEDYHRLVGRIFELTESKYGNRFKEFLRKHSLPNGFDVQNTSPTEDIGDGNGSVIVDSPQFAAQKKKIDKPELKDKRTIDAFYGKFFNKKPIKVLANWSEFQSLLKNPKEDSKALLLKYFHLDEDELGQKKILGQINEVILLKNMHLTDSEFHTARNDFKKDFDARCALLDGGYEVYYERYEGKDDEFITELLSPRDKLQPHVASVR